MKKIKTLTVNLLTAISFLLVSVLGLISVLQANRNLFSVIMLIISVVVSGIMVTRVSIACAEEAREKKKEAHSGRYKWQEDNEPHDLIDIAISVGKISRMFETVRKWFVLNDRDFHGTRIVGLCNAYDQEGNEDQDAALLLLIGTREHYERIKNDLENATVLDYWPIDMEKVFEQARNNEIPFLTWPEEKEEDEQEENEPEKENENAADEPKPQNEPGVWY